MYTKIITEGNKSNALMIAKKLSLFNIEQQARILGIAEGFILANEHFNKNSNAQQKNPNHLYVNDRIS